MKRKPKLRVVLVIVAVLVVFYAGYLFLHNYYQLRATREQRALTAEKYAQALEENAALQREAAYTQTDSFVRDMARELLGWVFPGEYKIVEETEGTQTN